MAPGIGAPADAPIGAPSDPSRRRPAGPPLDAPTGPLSERTILVNGRPAAGRVVNPAVPPDRDEGTALFQIRRPGARGDDPGWPGDDRADLPASAAPDHAPPAPPVRMPPPGVGPAGETGALRWSEPGPPRDGRRRDAADHDDRRPGRRDDYRGAQGTPRTGAWSAARDAWLADDPRSGGRWAPSPASGPAFGAPVDGPAAARGHDGEGMRPQPDQAESGPGGQAVEGWAPRGPSRAGSDRTGGDRGGSNRIASNRTASDRAASDRAGSDRAGSGRVVPDRVALDQVGLGRIAPERIRSGRSGSVGSAQVGSAQVGSGRGAAEKRGSGRSGRAAWADDEVWPDEVGSARAAGAARATRAGARHIDRSDDRAAPASGRRARAASWITAHWGGNASRLPHLPVIAVSVAAVLTLIAVTALLLVPSGSDGGADPIATTAGQGAAPTGQPGTAARPTQSGVPAAVVPQVERATTTGLFPTGVAAHTLTQANAWARFRGRPNDVVVMYTDRSSWSDVTNPWMGRSASTFSGYAGTWVITQPLFPDSGPEKGNLADCAAGNYDAKWRQFGRWLVNMGRGDSFVRLGWEFNGLWFAWSATDPQQWIQCFRNASSAIRATSPKVRIDWNLNAHGSTTPVGAFDLYPGDQYVDVIGIDSYDQYPPSPTYADFDNQCNGDAGLCQVITFARTHHKLFSVPEWGVVSQQGTKAGRSGAAGGDNPAYMEKMYETFSRNADILAYEAYFPDAEEGNVRSSLVNPDLNPASAAVYQRLWG
ncbi:hypothetical protein FRAAL6239 [Frankia alni ACN14a]|uniref:GH26 domain-containing protein n=1 Tax=Frankia alni (strain DSM 45986 / CECT 9034 / ACN14a) TaxID=326424 RepID=Q0RCG2_FRAAA|nr:hypothetical protein FRAAL6239 [Frankia alni ACN14a]